MVSEVRGKPLARAELVLRLAADEGATQAEVLLSEDESSLTRFANSEIHQNVAERDAQLSLRFIDGRRVGCASTNRLDDEALRLLVERAARIARLQPEQEEMIELPEPAPIAPVVGGFSEATATASPELRASGAMAVISAADEAGVLAYGSFTTTTERLGVSNSKGVRAYEERTWAQLLTVSMGPDGEAGYAEAAAVDVASIDAGSLGREAADKARRSRAAVALAPGEYPVVLEEYAVGDILEMLAYLGFSGQAVQEGRSFHEAGRVVGSPLVTIVDDAADPAGMPAAFDYEGVGKQRVVLIEDGVCRDVVHDTRTARVAGLRSTGHALPAPNTLGPLPLNLVMAGGETSRDELVRGLDRGLLVSRFHYTNPVHPKLAIITGMTRAGLFLVEGGEIVGPVRNLRFTQSYLDVLAGVQEVSRERRLLRGFLGPMVVPAMRVAAFEFTGVTEH